MQSIRQCSIEECERPHRARGYCALHWARYSKYGDPHKVLIRGVDYAVRQECRIDGCLRKSTSRQLCDLHYRRFLRYGDPVHPIQKCGSKIKGENPTIRAIHIRIKVARGRAREHACVSCGGMANEWSYEGGCPNELLEANASGTLMAYSEDISRYKPRCYKCHRKLDAAVRREQLNRGRGM